MGEHDQKDSDLCKTCVYWIDRAHGGRCYLDLHPGTCGHYTPGKTGPRDEPTEGDGRARHVDPGVRDSQERCPPRGPRRRQPSFRWTRRSSEVSGRAPTWPMTSAAAMPPMRAQAASPKPWVRPYRNPAA